MRIYINNFIPDLHLDFITHKQDFQVTQESPEKKQFWFHVTHQCYCDVPVIASAYEELINLMWKLRFWKLQ